VRQFLFDCKMTQKQIDGLNAILNYWDSSHVKKDDRWLAYILATTHHETGRLFQPIEEWGKRKGSKYGSKLKLNGKAYVQPDKLSFGRGFVQLTWYENYESVGKRLKVDLLNQPELALNLDVRLKY
jgi:putative chitinase